MDAIDELLQPVHTICYLNDVYKGSISPGADWFNMLHIASNSRAYRTIFR